MQNNNNVRKTIPEPLMFIHTVSTPILSNGSKKYYDSRDDKNHTLINSLNNSSIISTPNKQNIGELLYKKLQNVVQMYEKGHAIPCLIETKNNESIEGIPYKMENEKLYLKKDDDIIDIDLTNIKDAIILKI